MFIVRNSGTAGPGYPAHDAEEAATKAVEIAVEGDLPVTVEDPDGRIYQVCDLGEMLDAWGVKRPKPPFE